MCVWCGLSRLAQEGVLAGAVPSPTRRAFAGVPPNATVLELEQLVAQTRQQLTEERAKRLDLLEQSKSFSTSSPMHFTS